MNAWIRILKSILLTSLNTFAFRTYLPLINKYVHALVPLSGSAWAPVRLVHTWPGFHKRIKSLSVVHKSYIKADQPSGLTVLPISLFWVFSIFSEDYQQELLLVNSGPRSSAHPPHAELCVFTCSDCHDRLISLAVYQQQIFIPYSSRSCQVQEQGTITCWGFLAVS